MTIQSDFESWARKETPMLHVFSLTRTWKHPFGERYLESATELAFAAWQAALASQQPTVAKPYGYVTTLRNGTKHFYESMPYLDNAVKCDTVYLQSQAQQPTELAISAAMSEGNKLGIKSTDAARIVGAYVLQSQAQQERTKLIPMPTEENPRQWFFDCDDLYIDVEHLNGEVSIFVKHRSDNATGWKELIEKSQAQQDDICLECGRKKAKSADDCAAGLCPKWYAIRDKEAAKDCQNVSQAQQQDTDSKWAELQAGTLTADEARKHCGIADVPSQAQQTESQWISVEERLPESIREVIGVYWHEETERFQQIFCCYDADDEDEWISYGHKTPYPIQYWMESPSLPSAPEYQDQECDELDEYTKRRNAEVD